MELSRRKLPESEISTLTRPCTAIVTSAKRDAQSFSGICRTSGVALQSSPSSGAFLWTFGVVTTSITSQLLLCISRRRLSGPTDARFLSSKQWRMSDIWPSLRETTWCWRPCVITLTLGPLNSSVAATIKKTSSWATIAARPWETIMMVDMGLAVTSTSSPIGLQKTIVVSSAPRKFPPMAEPIPSFQYSCLICYLKQKQMPF